MPKKEIEENNEQPDHAQCTICKRPLKRAKYRKIGMGPVCARKHKAGLQGGLTGEKELDGPVVRVSHELFQAITSLEEDRVNGRPALTGTILAVAKDGDEENRIEVTPERRKEIARKKAAIMKAREEFSKGLAAGTARRPEVYEAPIEQPRKEESDETPRAKSGKVKAPKGGALVLPGKFSHSYKEQNSRGI